MTPEERAEATPVADLVKRLRHMGDRSDRHDYSIGDYWNAVEDAADALEAAERERDEAQQIAAKQIDEWVKGASQKLIDQRDHQGARPLMKTYTVIGTYRGPVSMTVKAKDLHAALNAFANADEDEIVILEPSRIEYDPDKVGVEP